MTFWLEDGDGDDIEGSIEGCRCHMNPRVGDRLVELAIIGVRRGTAGVTVSTVSWVTWGRANS